MKFKFNKSYYTIKGGEAYTSKGNIARDSDKIVKAFEDKKKYLDTLEPFHIPFKEFDDYLDSRTSKEKEKMFFEMVEAYQNTKDMIRYGKLTSKDLTRSINLLKKYETIIGKIIKS